MTIFPDGTHASLRRPPVVLSLSGHDPTGGAGIQADIESIRAQGVHALTLITALTAQDTQDVLAVYPQDPQHFLRQADCLLEDCTVDVFKVGLLGSAEIALAVASILEDHAHVPVVLDPVLAAGGGRDLAQSALLEVLTERILPQTRLATPNSLEARRLAGVEMLDESALRIQAMGCPNVLITGTHEESIQVVNRWYGSSARQDYCFARLPHDYHGSGCTLAASIAAFMALEMPLALAIERGQKATYAALSGAKRLGRGQWLPTRG